MKKYTFPKGLNFRLYIRKPRGKKSSFQIQKHIQGGSKVVKVEHPVLNAINENFLAQSISEEEAQKEIGKLIDRLYSEAGVQISLEVSNQENEAHLQRYWESEYSYRQIVDPKSSWNQFQRVIKALGPVSLMSASQQEIQQVLDKSFETNVHSRMVGATKSLLKFLGRHDVRLRKKRPPRSAPPYLTESDLKLLVQTIESTPFRLMVQMAFYSGCRKGELLALNEMSLKPDGSLYIGGQIKNGQEVEPKSGSVGSTFLFEEGRAIYKDWIKEKNNVTSYELAQSSRILRQFCKRAFPKHKEKWIRFHDLRHSYAIHLLGHGASLTDVAQCLRNDIRVCQRYYAGFLMNQSRMLGLKQLESSKKNNAEAG